VTAVPSSWFSWHFRGSFSFAYPYTWNDLKPDCGGMTMSKKTSTRIPLGFGDITASVGDHIGHFYKGAAQRFSVLGPFIGAGLQRADQCVCISSPDVADQLCQWLVSNGIDAEGACASGQLILHPGEATSGDMRALVDRIEAKTLKAGQPFVRWAGDGGWSMTCGHSVLEMLRWEALYDQCSVGWKTLALCQFDLAVFSGDVIMDTLRSHPICVVGEVVVTNPFHVAPETLLQELSAHD
jgi:hypothetical protein